MIDFYECPFRKVYEDTDFFGSYKVEFCGLNNKGCNQEDADCIDVSSCPRMEPTLISCVECGDTFFFDHHTGCFLCNGCGREVTAAEVMIQQQRAAA